ncbi:arabinan endo-1,5-alpha-L-arabinosidase [Rhizomicrobium electricum]|uniref:Extracellular exo-alpha-(1->5)-L-arabinofuranosidase n=1 Tax=Rhizomicrobium electricum TaxID=480070 RepID=A0ABP3QA83_9PROT|nr:arabinan endo-1,5-alpha-L-arabinosidase [Rhizomicrobium electricum]NIJ49484.1 arabinan endo-1,5-alpha-L-arabinosidase [Rhizomicrobium electricum]
MSQHLFHDLTRRGALLGGLAAAGTAAVLPALGADPEPLNSRLSGSISPVHDPCAIRDGDTYYVFSTNLGTAGGGQIPWRFSKDLITWEKGGTVLPDLPHWASETIPGTEGIWAPDISHVGGRYLLYYAVSTFGKNHSAIGLAINATLNPASPDYKWVDQGLVFESKSGDDFNAIDPNLVVDRDGKHWLAFGSFWGGIKMIPLDSATGKPAPGDKRIFTLANRPPGSQPNAIEAPFIIERGGFYYLFCAYDFCCRGADSNYYTVVGRSPTIAGPYGDHNRFAMATGNGMVVLPHNPGSRWRGPGGASILRDGAQDYIVYHAYDARRDGTPTLRIAPLVWSADGWPTAIV